MKRIPAFSLASRIVILSWFALAASTIPATPQATPKAAAQPPSAREIINRYVRAIGGRAAIVRYKSARMKGKFELVGQFTADLEVTTAAPNKLLVKISIPGLGDILRGFDGQVGWEMSPMAGPSLMKGKQLEQFRQQADFYSELRDEKNFQQIESLGKAEFAGKPCYKVRLITKEGDAQLEYFDVQSHLLVGKVQNVETPAGPTETTSNIAGYTRFGDLLIPSTVVNKYAFAGKPIEEKLTITSVEYDQVTAATFDLPSQVKALRDKPAR